MAVYIAVLIVDVITQNGGAFTPTRWTFFALAWIPPAINLLWLIPKVVRCTLWSNQRKGAPGWQPISWVQRDPVDRVLCM